MGQKSNEILKSIADEYALLIKEGISDKEKIQFFRKELGFLEDGEVINSRETNINPHNGDLIGIWRAKVEKNSKSFVRDEKFMNEFHHWARVNEITAKSEKYRVAFIGESVARGFLYDPHFTPASVLEEMLNNNLEKTKVEVIDLARVSIKIEELKQLCLQSLLLEPDALVIFAGNNWRKLLWALSEAEVTAIIGVMEDGDRFKKIRNILEDKCREMITSFMQVLNEIKYNYNLPITIIVPEFNLRDWKSNSSERILCWSNGEVEEWIKLAKRAEDALSEGKLSDAENFAVKMIKLNEANPLGYELLGNVKLKQGLTENARECFEAGIDTRIYRLGPPPGITTFIRQVMLEQAAKYQFNIVNLPEIFEKYSLERIPGNDLFIDYCHLSVEGISIAMKHTAQRLIEIIDERQVDITEVKSANFKPNDEIIGKAHFFAAVHSAHCGDMSYETLFYHCDKAAQSCKEVRELIVRYVDVAARKIPWALNKNYEEIFDSQYTILRQFRDCKVMDIKLVNAMLDALKIAEIDIKNEIDRLRIEEHKPTVKRKIDLLETYYRENSYFNTFTASKSVDYESAKQCCFNERNTESTFFLIAEKDNDVTINLTFRTPILESGTIKILVNGSVIAEKKSSKDWKNARIIIPHINFKEDGVNIIEIEWPLMDEAIAEINNTYKQRYSGLDLIVNRSRPVYGEIFRFNAAIME